MMGHVRRVCPCALCDRDRREGHESGGQESTYADHPKKIRSISLRAISKCYGPGRLGPALLYMPKLGSGQLSQVNLDIAVGSIIGVVIALRLLQLRRPSHDHQRRGCHRHRSSGATSLRYSFVLRASHGETWGAPLGYSREACYKQADLFLSKYAMQYDTYRLNVPAHSVAGYIHEGVSIK